MNKRTLFPNFLTILNIFLGYMAILYVLDGDYIKGAWLICYAALIDAFDGKIARLIKSSSSFGVEFDSLADLVSCGVAPAVLLYQVYFVKLGFLGAAISFAPVLAGAFRLARFNINLDEDVSKDQFYGLPVPIFAITASSYVIFNYHVWNGIRFTQSVIPFTLFLCLLMISTIRFEAFPKFSMSGSRGNTIKLVLFIFCFVLYLIIPSFVLFPICFGFILVSLFRWIWSRFREESTEADEAVDYTVIE